MAVDLPSLRKTHEAHVRADARHEAASAEAQEGMTYEEHSERKRGANQHLGRGARRGIAEELQRADDQLRPIHGIHGEEDIEHEEHDVELNGLH